MNSETAQTITEGGLVAMSQLDQNRGLAIQPLDRPLSVVDSNRVLNGAARWMTRRARFGIPAERLQIAILKAVCAARPNTLDYV